MPVSALVSVICKYWAADNQIWPAMPHARAAILAIQTPCMKPYHLAMQTLCFYLLAQELSSLLCYSYVYPVLCYHYFWPFVCIVVFVLLFFVSLYRFIFPVICFRMSPCFPFSLPFLFPLRNKGAAHSNYRSDKSLLTRPFNYIFRWLWRHSL